MNKKRILSLLLALCMLVSVISIDTVVEAASSQELVNAALADNGATISVSEGHEGSNFWWNDYGATLEKMIDTEPSRTFGITKKAADMQYTPITLTVQFDGTYEVSQVQLWGAGLGGFPVAFKLQAYTGTDWEDVGSYTNVESCQGGQHKEFTFDAITCTQFRMVTSENGVIVDNGNTHYGVCLGSFEIYGVKLDNVALSGNDTKISSSFPTGDYMQNTAMAGLEKMIDGEDGNYGVTGMSPDYQYKPISIDLRFNETYQISQIRLRATADGVNGFPVDFTLEVFTANGWKVVVTQTDYPVPAANTWIEFSFDAVVCTAVRLTATENGTNGSSYFIGLREFEVYGTEADETISPLPDASDYSAVQTSGTAFCSSAYTYNNIKLSSLNDGVTNNGGKFYSSDFFANPDGGQYAGVLFEDTYCFNQVSLNMLRGDVIPEDFRISVYNGEEWVDVVTEPDYPTRDSGMYTVDFTFPEIYGNAVKVTADTMRMGDTSKNTYAMQIGELIINGAITDLGLEQPEVELYNVASGMNVSASSVVDWGAPTYGSDLNNLVDISGATNYSSVWSKINYNYEWVRIDFDAPVRAHHVYITPWIASVDGANVTRFPKDFTIEVYTGTEWKTVVEQTDYAKPCYKFCFTPIECTAIRMVVTEMDNADADTNYAFVIKDFKVYADSANTILNQPENIGEKLNRSEASVAISQGVNNAALRDSLTNGVVTYTSQLVENAEDEIAMQFMFARSVYIDSMKVFVHNDDAGKFPSDFTVYAFTGNEWEEVFSATGYTCPDNATDHYFSFEGVYCNSIVIVAKNLYQIGDKYGVRLRNVNLLGFFEDDASILLGDGNGDNKLSDAEDLAAFRTYIVNDTATSSKFDVNMDNAGDVRDLVRMKRYFKGN